MSSTFFFVSTKIIILFPLSTPSSLRSLDNLGKEKKKKRKIQYYYEAPQAYKVFSNQHHKGYLQFALHPNNCGNEA
jgi:CRISPR/Cas system CSM-associated protein Csm4 (group 5 of RAMP superfamily)